MQQLGLAGLVHDIGKISIPTQVLHKRGDMTAAEMAMVQRHPSVGYRILNEARLYSNILLDVCVHHHERIDGRGYPFGLHGHEISVHAKIAAVCDTYDSLTSSRPGHRAWTPARALEYMAVRRPDTLFDRTVFQAFTRSIGTLSAGHGAALALRTAGGGVCTERQRAAAPPGQGVLTSLSEATQVGPETLDLSEAEDTIVSFEDPAQWGFRDEQLLELCAA
ncbi:HD-GYP domain-containing protein [Cupriavidus basilensis]